MVQCWVRSIWFQNLAFVVKDLGSRTKTMGSIRGSIIIPIPPAEVLYSDSEKYFLGAGVSAPCWSQCTMLESVHHAGVSAPRWSQCTALESAHRAGVSAPCWSQRTVLESAHLAGVSAPCWSQRTVLESAHRAGVSAPCWSQRTVLESAHGAGVSAPCWSQRTVLESVHRAGVSAPIVRCTSGPIRLLTHNPDSHHFVSVGIGTSGMSGSGLFSGSWVRLWRRGRARHFCSFSLSLYIYIHTSVFRWLYSIATLLLCWVWLATRTFYDYYYTL